MSKYAVIQLQGKQFQVSENDQFVVDQLAVAEGEKLKITDVLLVVDGEKRLVGTPLVDGAVVTAKVDNHTQGDKIRVFKYKSKSKYRRTMGHRQQQSVITIDKITV